MEFQYRKGVTYLCQGYQERLCSTADVQANPRGVSSFPGQVSSMVKVRETGIRKAARSLSLKFDTTL